MRDAVIDFRSAFGCTPLEALLDERKRAHVMEVYASYPDSDGVRRRLDVLHIARCSGHLMSEDVFN